MNFLETWDEAAGFDAPWWRPALGLGLGLGLALRLGLGLGRAVVALSLYLPVSPCISLP